MRGGAFCPAPESLDDAVLGVLGKPLVERVVAPLVDAPDHCLWGAAEAAREHQLDQVDGFAPRAAPRADVAQHGDFLKFFGEPQSVRARGVRVAGEQERSRLRLLRDETPLPADALHDGDGVALLRKRAIGVGAHEAARRGDGLDRRVVEAVGADVVRRRLLGNLERVEPAARTPLLRGGNLGVQRQAQARLAPGTVQDAPRFVASAGGPDVHHPVALAALDKVLRLHFHLRAGRLKAQRHLFVEDMSALAHLRENAPIRRERVVDDLLLHHRPLRDLRELDLGQRAQVWARQVNPEGVVALNQRDPEDRRREPALRRHFDVVPLLHLLDVLGDGGVGADAVLVHEADEVLLPEQLRRRGGPVPHLEDGRDDTLAGLEPRDGLVRPLVVHVDGKVVLLDDHLAAAPEELAALLEEHRGDLAQGVVGAARKEPAGDELVDACLLPAERPRRRGLGGVDCGVCLVVVSTVPRHSELPAGQLARIRRPRGV